jgi:hypothetical protein
MQPAHYRFGGGGEGILLHPLVAAFTVFALILIFFLPRKYVIVPLLLALLLTPKGQQIVFAGLHFNVFRIVLLAGLGRWLVKWRRAPLPGGFNSIDRVVAACAVTVCVIFSLQWAETQATIKAIGDLLDALGSYFVFRVVIRDRHDLRRAIQVLAFLAIIMGAEMINEQRTGHDLFGELGGTSAIPDMRDGKIRSQAAFRHSIPAGAYGATLIPLLVWLWTDKKSRKLVVLGVAGATAMVFTCHSSSDMGAYAAGVFALCLWPLRRQMRYIRYGIAGTVIGLHLVMKGPVWSILEHINLTGSSEGFHRYMLVDTFIRHFSDWWLLGTRDNGSWGWEMADTSNQYVTYGIAGGLLVFSLFIATISRGFGRLGTTRQRFDGNTAEEWIRWCLGCSLFAFVVVYIGIGLFDQLQFSWYLLLAMISMTVSAPMPARRLSRRRPPPESSHTVKSLSSADYDTAQLASK